MTKKIQHVAIIMDGNGRWAKKRLLPRNAGHIAGVKATKKIIRHASVSGLTSLTLYAFSKENWQRPKEETSHLMNLFISSLKKEIDEMHANKIQIHFIGVRSELSEKLQMEMEKAEQLTRDNKGLKLNIAINYGGRSEIIEAVKSLAKKKADFSQLTEADFEQELDLYGQPDVDMLIRTGGEKRVSNFLLWSIAYAELYFTDVFWPDFNEQEMDKAFNFYHSRERRFGKTSEQVN